MRCVLTDDEWTAIEPMLPNKPRGVPRVNNRRALNGIFWVLRSGAPWRANDGDASRGCPTETRHVHSSEIAGAKRSDHRHAAVPERVCCDSSATSQLNDYRTCDEGVAL